MRKESRDVAAAFLRGDKFSGARSFSAGHSMWLHDKQIVCRVRGVYSMTLAGHATQTTLSRLNAFTTLAFGAAMFRMKQGKVYFGPGFLREVDPNEHLTLPVNFRVGDMNV